MPYSELKLPSFRTESSYEEWSKAFHEWVDGNMSVSNSADRSRETIYGGRGE